MESSVAMAYCNVTHQGLESHTERSFRESNPGLRKSPNIDDLTMPSAAA